MVDLVLTADGSHTLKLKDKDEHYHSTHGALQESTHVFIKSGLDLFCNAPEVNVLEVGLGTGVNALLTEVWTRMHPCNVQYYAIEPYPLDLAIIEQLNYVEVLGKDLKPLLKSIHTAEDGLEVQISHRFWLTRATYPIVQLSLIDKFDLVYFDAFGPRTQPEMWTTEIFDKLFRSCRTGAVLVTYCAKGQVRRDLEAVGFEVERLPGPPGKREMIRAKKP